MKITQGYPPNYDDICKVFNIRGRAGIVFTYGDTIYIPGGMQLPSHLLAHEKVHIEQQTKMGAEKWWKKYLVDSEFRLDQEVEAYRAQYKAMFALQRSMRRIIFRKLCNDLAGPMYGYVVSNEEAARLIRGDDL